MVQGALGRWRWSCRLIVAAWFLGAGATPSIAEMADPREAVARAVVLDLVAGETGKVVARFDERMREKMSESALRQVWTDLIARIGVFRSMSKIEIEHTQGHDVVRISTRFAKAQIETRVTLDASRRVAGLFFLPAASSPPAAAAYDPPAYVDSKTFVEREIRVVDPLCPCDSGTCGLPGTLTLPVGAKAAPGVVLVHGSGPNDRDETVGSHRPFKDLAWGLAGRGIAVLRYEKRTRILKTRLDAVAIEAMTLKEETISDASAGVRLLRGTPGIDPDRVFVLGHSLGGAALPRIGAADPSIAGFISLAGAARPLEDILIEQVRYLARMDPGTSSAKQNEIARLEVQIRRVKTLKAGDRVDRSELPEQIPVAYWLDLAQNPWLKIAEHERRSYLVLQGERDHNVTRADVQLWRSALRDNPAARFKTYPKLNHLFSAGDGPSTPAEYQQPGHVDGEVVTDIADFVLGGHPAK